VLHRVHFPSIVGIVGEFVYVPTCRCLLPLTCQLLLPSCPKIPSIVGIVGEFVYVPTCRCLLPLTCQLLLPSCPKKEQFCDGTNEDCEVTL
jgi:hypothetical protein